MRRAMTALVTAAVGLAAALTIAGGVHAASTEALALPGNRPNYVFSLMAARYNGAFARIGTWQFQTTGAVTERYWYWSQTQAPSTPDWHANRDPSGYVTNGCPKVCAVWTASTFLPGVAPTTRTGSWSYTSDGKVHIVWAGTIHEYYSVTDRGTYTDLNLSTHNYQNVSTVYSRAFGSTLSLSQGATIDQIKASAALNFTVHEQNWNAVTVTKSNTIWWGQYHRCASSPCLQGNNPHSVDDDGNLTGYHTYFAGNPATDGRKTYWYHQLEAVALNPDCAVPSRGGHTYQLLQAIDDNGTFIGFVGAEASLLSRTYGGSIITHFVALKA